MLSLLFNDKFISKLADKISRRVQDTQSDRFDTIIDNIERLHTDMKLMEDRLTKKEMQDRMSYGQLQYKMSSLESELKQKPAKNKKQLESH